MVNNSLRNFILLMKSGIMAFTTFAAGADYYGYDTTLEDPSEGVDSISDSNVTPLTQSLPMGRGHDYPTVVVDGLIITADALFAKADIPEDEQAQYLERPTTGLFIDLINKIYKNELESIHILPFPKTIYSNKSADIIVVTTKHNHRE